jgi:hypothetical protein
MSDFELNEDRNEFEILEDFVYNGSNNSNSSKRLVKEVNEQKFKKKPKSIGRPCMVILVKICLFNYKFVRLQHYFF